MELLYFFVPFFAAMGWWYVCIGRTYRFRQKLIQFTYDKEGRAYPEWWDYVGKKKKWFDEQLSYDQMMWKLIILQGPQRFITGEFADKFLDRMDNY